MRKFTKDNEGITLITLIVIIVVLLILAGLSIISLTGENGLLVKANEAIKETRKGNLKEEIKLSIINTNMDKQIIYRGNLEEELRKIGNAIVDKIADDMYYIKRDNEEYTVYEDGTIFDGKIEIWDGTEQEPKKISDTEYNIENAMQLKWLSNKVNQGNDFSGITFYVINHIDLGGRKNSKNDWEGNQWIPIGTSENVFSGTFNGNNYTIRGIYIENDQDYQGLFGRTLGGQLLDIKLERGYIKAHTRIGGIVGQNGAEIINCYNNCEIRGNEFVGGMVGFNNSNIRNCTNDGNIISEGETNWHYRSTGGIAGRHNGTIIEKCCNHGNIEGKGYGVGGIAGLIYGYTINVEFCYNTGSIKGEVLHTGGIVGDNNSSRSVINNCYNIGTVTGDSSVGGISGRNVGTISNSCNVGNVKGNVQDAVGIAGEGGNIINTYYRKGCVSVSIEEQEKDDVFMKSLDFFRLLNQGQSEECWIQVEGEYPKLNMLPVT